MKPSTSSFPEIMVTFVVLAIIATFCPVQSSAEYLAIPNPLTCTTEVENLSQCVFIESGSVVSNGGECVFVIDSFDFTKNGESCYVPAILNSASDGFGNDDSSFYQCTEYVLRYLHLRYGTDYKQGKCLISATQGFSVDDSHFYSASPAVDLTIGKDHNGNDIELDIPFMPITSIDSLREGDVMITNSHVAVVKAISNSQAIIIEQNNIGNNHFGVNEERSFASNLFYRLNPVGFFPDGWHHDGTSKAIWDAYNDAGGYDLLGPGLNKGPYGELAHPYSYVSCFSPGYTPDTTVYIQDVGWGDDTWKTICYSPGAEKAYILQGCIGSLWWQFKGKLGPPISNEGPAGEIDEDFDVVQYFKNGYMLYRKDQGLARLHVNEDTPCLIIPEQCSYGCCPAGRKSSTDLLSSPLDQWPLCIPQESSCTLSDTERFVYVSHDNIDHQGENIKVVKLNDLCYPEMCQYAGKIYDNPESGWEKQVVLYNDSVQPDFTHSVWDYVLSIDETIPDDDGYHQKFCCEQPIESSDPWSVDFENDNLGIYGEEAISGDWICLPFIELPDDPNNRYSYTNIIAGAEAYSGKSLQVVCPSNRDSLDGRINWMVNLNRNYEELYCAYRIRFHPDFDFRKGGKLPGFAGRNANSNGDKPTGYDGWSARVMWREGGRIVQYLYHPDQPCTQDQIDSNQCWGEDLQWNTPPITKGEWHQVQQRIKMNTPGQHDGIIEIWFDGVKVLSRNDIRFRDTNLIGIDKFRFAVFFGGQGEEYKPLKNEEIYFDDFQFSTQPLISEVGCNCTDNDGDGIIDQWDECSDTISGAVVLSNGCPSDSLFSQAQLNNAVTNMENQKNLEISDLNTVIETMFTQEEMESAVDAETAKWDAQVDGKVGLDDIVYQLQQLSAAPQP